MQPQTPGVYIKELNAFPNSVVEVATAVPVFIGYTAKADYNGQSLDNKPQRLTSLSDYETYFGQGAVPLFDLQDQSTASGGTPAPAVAPINMSINDISVAAPAPLKQYALTPVADSTIFYLHNSIRLFYQNGGGACYVVSIGKYGSNNAADSSQETVQPANAGGVVGSKTTSSAPPTPITPQKDDFVTAIDSLIYEQEPTMLLCPDALNLSSDDYYAVVQKMLQHCNDTQSRVAVLDVYGGAVTNPLDLNKNDSVISLFRDGVGTNNLKYGVSYFPWVVTTVVGANETTFQNLSKNVFDSLAGGAQAAVDAANSAVMAKKDKPDLSAAQQTLRNVTAYNNLVKNAQLLHAPSIAAAQAVNDDAAKAAATAKEDVTAVFNAATKLNTYAKDPQADLDNLAQLVKKLQAASTKATSTAPSTDWAAVATTGATQTNLVSQALTTAQNDTNHDLTAIKQAVATALTAITPAFNEAQPPATKVKTVLDDANKLVELASNSSPVYDQLVEQAQAVVDAIAAAKTAMSGTNWDEASGKANDAFAAASTAKGDNSKLPEALQKAKDAQTAATDVSTAFTNAQKLLAVQAQIAADYASAKASLITNPPAGQTAAQAAQAALAAAQTAQDLATKSQTDAVNNGVAWVSKARAYANLANTAVQVVQAAATANGTGPTVLQAQNAAAAAAAAADDAATAASTVMTDAETQTEVLRLHNALRESNPDYKRIIDNVTLYRNTLPVAPAMAGVYTYVDNSRGVWKAPANVSLNVVKPTVNLSDNDQARLNVDAVSGKSVNAIRPFPSLGVLVWGARTLDGNSQDWRYVNVRRTMIFLEQSIKLAARSYVFEPNDANTWVTVQSMLSNFLHNMWQAGALEGTKPEEAYSVTVGLGSTMTGEDILDGLMNVTVKVAISHPAEFVVLSFQQLMQTS